MAVEHIRPFAHGNGERLNNLQLLCTACNSLKGTGTMAQLKKRLVAKGVIKAQAKTSGKAAVKARAKTKTAKKRAAKKPASVRRR